jgi:hypothetical protein
MRKFNNYRPIYSGINFPERILSALCFVPGGIGMLVGFGWLIYSHVKKMSLSRFARFHIFQSFFINILLAVLGLAFGIIDSLVGFIPLLGEKFVNLVYYLIRSEVIFGYSLVNFIIIITFMYIALCALTGRYGNIPWVSDMVRKMV